MDLSGIREYLAPAPRHIQARILTELRAGFSRVTEFPLTGLLESQPRYRILGPVRSILVAPYRIFYLPETSPRIIFAILHGKQDIASILKSRLK
jgi:plasmid stabilization system protein ParE